MKRADYNEFLYIWSTIRKDQKNGTCPIMWHIRTDYSAELKQRIDELIRSTGFYPCRVGECSMWRDGNEYIIYIPYSSEQKWLELTTRKERADIEAALHR